MGQAYAFFDGKATIEDIKAELPTIRSVVRTPSELELSLDENDGSIQGDSGLMEIAQSAREENLKYVMRADHPNATNKATAKEVGAILNQAYQSPLYQEGEPFRGEVVYEDNGEYVFIE